VRLSNERDRLKVTFDQVAALYDQVRPGYPEALFDDVISLSGIPPGGRVLEIGCGTGQATVPLARRGFSLLGIELGENLAAVARRNLAAYPGVEVRTGAFEAWPLEEGAFDLVVAATAFHWIDPAIRYRKSARALRPGGTMAIFENLHVQGDACGGFFEAVQEIYERETPELIPKDYRPLQRPHEVSEPYKGEIDQTGIFGAVTVRHYGWDQVYDAAGYLRVLDTYSGHRSLENADRERLFRGIAQLIDGKFGGRVTKSYLTVLYTARPVERRAG
jgi:SAM-dependent methyltransferase